MFLVLLACVIVLLIVLNEVNFTPAYYETYPLIIKLSTLITNNSFHCEHYKRLYNAFPFSLIFQKF